MQKSGYQPLTVNIGIAHSSQNQCLASDASEHAQLPNFRESPKRWKLLDLQLLAECSKRQAAVPRLNKGKCSPHHHPKRSRRIARRNVSEGLSP
jgi:hypothetical protein